MNSIVLDSVGKIFCHRPTLFNWFGNEREGTTRALDDVSLKVAAGDILVILGPNGSGKTTTLKLISTLLLPDSGQVFVNGFEPRKHSNEVRRRVSFAIASERSFFPRLSARENLDFFAALDDVPRSQRASRIADLLDYTGLSEAADMLVMKFSSGMYQRLAIARALLKCPSVILLDEPTRSLDPASAAHFWGVVRNLRGHGATVMLATHSFFEAVAVGDEVAVLHRGQLAGFRKVAGAGADDLRGFYFATTGEVDEAEYLMPRSRP